MTTNQGSGAGQGGGGQKNQTQSPTQSEAQPGQDLTQAELAAKAQTGKLPDTRTESQKKSELAAQQRAAGQEVTAFDEPESTNQSQPGKDQR